MTPARIVAAVVGGLLCACALSIVVSVSAQEPQGSAAPALALTDIEQRDRDLLLLKAQLTQAYRQIAELQAVVGTCQGQLGTYQHQQNAQALEEDRRRLAARVEERTGYTYDPTSGTFGAKKPVPTEPARKPGG
jgi:hypothetical protein